MSKTAKRKLKMGSSDSALRTNAEEVMKLILSSSTFSAKLFETQFPI